MMKLISLLSVIQFAAGDCPADQPSCLYQIPATSAGALNLWYPLSCTSVATSLYFVYENVSTVNVITQIGVYAPTYLSVKTPSYLLATNAKTISLATLSVK